MQDVVIVGAGMGGLFAAYTLINEHPQLKVQIVDRGKKLSKRFCPVTDKIPCQKCNPCAIMSGEIGAGGVSGF